MRQLRTISLSSLIFLSLAGAAMASEDTTTSTAQVVGPPCCAASPEVNSSENDWSYSASLSLASGRDFKKQQFSLYRGPTAEAEFYATRGRYTCGVWVAETGDPVYNEQDFTCSGTFGNLTVGGGIYVLDGPEVWDIQASYRVPVNETSAVTFTVDVMHGPTFSDETFDIAFETGGDLSDRWSWSADVGASHSRWADGVNVFGGGSVSYAISDEVAVSFGIVGFAGENDEGAVASVTLAREW